jgi:hypothetical protein
VVRCADDVLQFARDVRPFVVSRNAVGHGRRECAENLADLFAQPRNTSASWPFAIGCTGTKA